MKNKSNRYLSRYKPEKKSRTGSKKPASRELLEVVAAQLQGQVDMRFLLDCVKREGFPKSSSIAGTLLTRAVRLGQVTINFGSPSLKS